VSANFLSLESGQAGRILGFMRGLYAHDSIRYDLDRARETCEWLIANPGHGGIWVIRSEGRDAGYLIVTQCVSIEFGGRFALLDELYVDEAFRGQGLGAEAVEFAAAWARERGLKAIRLETAHDNERARGLYRKCGYVVDERHLMTRWL
jgi:ribosomal protein S18 acetylase RimI-like enzyme